MRTPNYKTLDPARDSEPVACFIPQIWHRYQPHDLVPQ